MGNSQTVDAATEFFKKIGELADGEGLMESETTEHFKVTPSPFLVCVLECVVPGYWYTLSIRVCVCESHGVGGAMRVRSGSWPTMYVLLRAFVGKRRCVWWRGACSWPTLYAPRVLGE